MKRVLMVVFQFPPFAGSSAVQRTLRFVQQLPKHGWEPIVLTARASAYESTSADLLRELPAETIVHRAFALDAARHLSLAGRYPRFLARPDRWNSWRFAAVSAGRSLVARYEPAAVWSTYPIATAHLIAHRLAAGGLPWIADFRDPMAQEGYPADPSTWKAFKAIEEATVRRARFSVFTTPGAARAYADRYREADRDRFCVIENGFDESSFAGLDDAYEADGPLVPGRVTILHTGVVYPQERDPTQFFAALARLKARGVLDAAHAVVRFRAPGDDRYLAGLAGQFGISDLIEVLPAVPYREALREMCRADGLVVLQGADCNQQIPAKVYEYLRAARPILGLTDPAGDTAGTLIDAGVTEIAPLNSAGRIEAVLEGWIETISSSRAVKPDATRARRNSRTVRAEELAALLDRAAGL